MLLTKALRRSLPPIKATEGQDDPIVRVKFFNPAGASTWLAIEFDGQDEFYGWVTHGDDQCAELGYFSLAELAGYRGPPFGLGIERDKFFTPCPLSGALRSEGHGDCAYLRARDAAPLADGWCDTCVELVELCRCGAA